MSEVKVYHKDLGFPRGVVWPKGKFPLRYTYHAKDEARIDPLGDVSRSLPDRLDMERCTVVEAQVEEEKRVRLMVCRLPLDSQKDLVLVVKTEATPWSVLTVYLNRTDDTHGNLDTSRYVRPL